MKKHLGVFGTLLSLVGAALYAGSSKPVDAQSTGDGWGVRRRQHSSPYVTEPPSERRVPARPPSPPPASELFRQTIDRVIQMPMDSSLQSRVQRLGLNVVNVNWEDTGRNYGSSSGPNISDLTLQVRESLGGSRVRTHLLPVIRHPNFTDRTADIAADRLWVRIGNERRGQTLQAVPLLEVIQNLTSVVSRPSEWNGASDLSAARDTHFLVSAQHVFVPIPTSGGVSEFNPVLFNYQSQPGSPAVLVLLVTREGTSVQVIENRRGDQTMQGWGQQLFFNRFGQKTVFTAERRSEVQHRIESGRARSGDEGALEEGADMMMIVQVPLRVPERRREYDSFGSVGGGASNAPMAEAAPASPPSEARARSAPSERSDVESAVIGHSEAMGRFVESNRLRLVRDDRFPIRVTIQFYKATSNGVVSEEDIQAVHEQIERVYRDGDYVGSLVVPRGQQRPTDWHH